MDTMDPVYVQVISGFIVSIVSILVINFFVVKKKFLVPNLFSGVKMFRATMAASVRHNIKEVPKHVAVIMDGNRRFGKKTHADPIQGHWAGGQTLVDFVQWCIEEGVEILTVYAFSTENWSRDPLEVAALMTIFAKYAESMKCESLSRNVRVRVLSTDLDRLPEKVQHAVRDLETATAGCTGFEMNICMSYGSRQEIVDVCKVMAGEVSSGNLCIDDITEQTFSSRLQTKDIPDPDVLIRTSGEYRLSNFLLWQLSYTELFFVNKFWPEINRDDLRDIIKEYVSRQRRFGK